MVMYDRIKNCAITLISEENDSKIKDIKCIFVVVAYHNKWNGRLTRHPNIWTIVRSMKDEERRAVRQRRHADRGDVTKLPRRKWRLLDKRIRRLKLQYRMGTRSLDSYWSAVAYVMHNN